MIVHADHLADIVAGLHILLQDKDPIVQAVRELRLLGMKVFQLADFHLRRIQRHQVALVEVADAGRKAEALLSQ